MARPQVKVSKMTDDDRKGVNVNRATRVKGLTLFGTSAKYSRRSRGSQIRLAERRIPSHSWLRLALALYKYLHTPLFDLFLAHIHGLLYRLFLHCF